MKLLSILKTTASGAALGAMFGISRHFFRKKQPSRPKYSSYESLSSNIQFVGHMDQLKKFQLYDKKQFDIILYNINRFLSIPEIIYTRKEFSLIHRAYRYLNNIESSLRKIRKNIMDPNILKQFHEVEKTILDDLKSECTNMNRDVKENL